MAYQWIVTFTTMSTTVPPRPTPSTIATLVGNLFASPTNIWLAGPQSVDDGAGEAADGPVEVAYQWVISLQTTDTKAPSHEQIQAELQVAFGATVDNVWLAGPQSVDDGPVQTDGN